MTLSPISADDPALHNALHLTGLPVTDLGDGDATYFALADGDAPIAFGRIAGDGTDWLLRSVVVPEATRRTGIGSRIVIMLDGEAKRAGADRLWLLATDAASFFECVGWQTVDRSKAPSAIRQFSQFASICPASATLMVRRLTP